MMAIFVDMVENIMEIFMDDLSVFRYSFDHCLHNLSLVLERREEMNLVLVGKNSISWCKKALFLGTVC